MGGNVRPLSYYMGYLGPDSEYDPQMPLMAEPLHVMSGDTPETFTYFDWTFTASTNAWLVSPELQQFP